MAKRKSKANKIFFRREQKINQLIKKFADYTFNHNVNNLNLYDETNRLRLDIKMNLDIQSEYLHTQSRMRRFVYYDQLSRFKSVYSIWKKKSFPSFIVRAFKVPEHLLNSITWFYVGLKKNYNVSYSIF